MVGSSILLHMIILMILGEIEQPMTSCDTVFISRQFIFHEMYDTTWYKYMCSSPCNLKPVH